MIDCLNFLHFAYNLLYYLQKQPKVALIASKIIRCNNQNLVETRERINVEHFKKPPDLF